MLPNQVTKRIGFLVILRENTEAPRDEEWDETLRLLTLHPNDLDKLKVLVVTDGGGPSPAQRKRLDQALKGTPIRVAVVSESVKVRFIVSSVALVTSRIQSFRQNEMDAAFDHLGLDRQARETALRAVREMSAMVAPKS